jgi:uncharacterized protein YerC
MITRVIAIIILPGLSWRYCLLYGGTVPRSKDLTLISRNQQIREMKDEGRTLQAIADTTGLSKARVGQILAQQDEEIGTDAYRAWLRAQGEAGLAKLQEILRKPPAIKVTPSGRLVYEPVLGEDGIPLRDNKGQFIPDPSKPVHDDSVVIDAIRAFPGLLDRLSKLSGADMRTPPPEGPDTALVNERIAYFQEKISRIRELEAKLAELGVAEDIVEAELVEDNDGRDFLH